MTIAGVDSLEKKLNMAQDELGIPPYNRIPVQYRNQSETLSVVVFIHITFSKFSLPPSLPPFLTPSLPSSPFLSSYFLPSSSSLSIVTLLSLGILGVVWYTLNNRSSRSSGGSFNPFVRAIHHVP